MNPLETVRLDWAFQALDTFKIEVPSWGFANTGTRFGKFLQKAAATTLEEKFADAAEVLRLTGATPTIALHVLWDLPEGIDSIAELKALEKRFGIKAGSINPNLFQDQLYKFGSLCNPDGFHRDREGDRVAGYFSVAGGRVELPRIAEHPQENCVA
jgi:L-rhamnose isomerase/sugar isomerase